MYKFQSNFVCCQIALIFYVFHYARGFMVDNNPFRRRETLDQEGKYQLEWIVDTPNKIVTFNVTVQTRGFIGFGLSDKSKMGGADIVIGGVSDLGKPYFSDYYALGNQQPELDSSQDWTFLSASDNETHTMLSFSRLFDTCDLHDYPITEDHITLLWAFGEHDSETAYYHYQNRGAKSVYLIHPDYTPEFIINSSLDTPEIVDKSSKDLNVWTIRSSLELPARDTSYWCTMYKAPQLERKHHMVGFEVRLDTESSVRHVHHLLVHKCNPPRGRDARTMFEPFTFTSGQECLRVKFPTGPMPTEYCTEFFHSWAVGGRAVFHPPDVGSPFGRDPEEYYIVQTHLDNPRQLRNVKVEIKLDFFYTQNLRKKEAGLMLIRHESPGLSPSLLIPPHSIEHKTYAICGSGCTQTMLSKNGIDIFAIYLHTHNAGRRIRLQHFRNNKELPWVANDDNYSFNYQQMRVMPQRSKILPGDQLVARCEFDNPTNRTLVGGFSTSQEMCVAIIMYYGKLTDYVQCSSEIQSDEYRAHFLAGVRNVTWSDRQLEYVVDAPHPLAGLTISEVADNHVNWTLTRRETLERFHLYHPHVNNCPRELYSVDRDSDDVNAKSTSGNSNNSGISVTLPSFVTPYQQPASSCSLDYI